MPYNLTNMNIMKKMQVCGMIIVVLLFSSCDSRKDKSFGIENCPVVAERVVTLSNDTLVVCDMSLVKDTLVLPLSSLFSDFEIIDLEEDHEDALVMAGQVFVSDNYIGFFSSQAGGYKLFDKKGKYLHTVSSRGGGPQEYASFIYDSNIDEANNRVYLLPATSKNILVFDMQGNFLESIPLAYSAGKARFLIDNKKQNLLISVLPFPNTSSVFWMQDFQGNVIQEVPSGHHIIDHPDFSNEVEVSLNMDIMDFSLFHWTPQNDTLYHYDEAHNILRPVFTSKFRGDIIQHSYIELPSQYLVRLYFQNTSGDFQYQFVLVDKKTLRGCYVKFELDMLGDIPGPKWVDFRRGYYIANMYAYELKAQLETALASKTLTPEIREKIHILNEGISEDDNNVVMLGKLKQGIQEIKLQADSKSSEAKLPVPVEQNEKNESEIVDTATNERQAEEAKSDTNDRIYAGWDDMKLIKNSPQFIGGFADYFRNNTKYKDWDTADKKEVKLRFVAEKDGTTSNVEIIESSGNSDLDNEAIRLIQEASLTVGINLNNEPIRLEMFISVHYPQ